MKFAKLKIAIAASLLATGSAHAGIDDQMREAFGALINTTNPASFETARRGGISGGSLFMKTPVKRTNLMSATAPSFSAGCGGIDLYGGSFSFISADEFIETFQAIGANAIGYGVKIAIQSACPTCEQVMTSLEKTAQFINSMNVDSCQAAQGIVNAGIDFAQTGKADTEAKTYGVNSGQWEDINEAWGWATKKGESPTQNVTKASPEKANEILYINATWKALFESKVAELFGADTEFNELVMTMIGTAIVEKPDSTKNSADPKLSIYQGTGITLKNLMDGKDDQGNNLKVYKCNDTSSANACNKVELTKTISIKGFTERVNDSLIGPTGLVQAYINDSEWSTEAKQVLSYPTIIGPLCVKKIRETSIKGTVNTQGIQIANLCAERMALELAYNQVMSYIDAAKSALSNLYVTSSQETAKAQALDMLEVSRKRYLDEYRKLDSTATFSDIYIQLNAIDNSNQGGDSLTGK
ncbi:conjugal transfer protein TraH [Vibrio cholerae]